MNSIEGQKGKKNNLPDYNPPPPPPVPNPDKGLRYNHGRLKWSLVDFDAFEPMVKVLMYGAHKYTIFEGEDGKQIKGVDIPMEEASKLKVLYSGTNNWKKGLKVTEVMESLQRHINALMRGEDNDPESGLPHIGHMQCNVMFLAYMLKFLPDMDDRFVDSNKKSS